MKQTLLLCITLLSMVRVNAQSAYNIPEKARNVIDSTYKALLKKNKAVGVSIAIVENGKIVYATGYGFADVANKVPATEQTIYRIGSCTKSFTALSIMQLQEKGLVDVKQSVKTYLPELTIQSRFNDTNTIVIDDMLRHVSGLPCDITNGFYCDSPPDMKWVIQQLNQQTTMSPKRYTRAYSNIAYGLLGEVVARTSQSTYEQYVNEHIFKPLNMQSSFITYEEKWAAKYAKGYRGDKETRDPMIRDAAAGLIHSNVVDMSQYLMMYLSKGNYNGVKIAAPQSVTDMEQSTIENVTLPDDENWGYGLYSSDIMFKKGNDSSVMQVIGHGGDTYIYHADFKFIPGKNIGAVVLTNNGGGARMVNATKLLKLYLQVTQGDTLISNPESVRAAKRKVSADTYCSGQAVLGKYNLGSFVIPVTNPTHISFKQGPVKVVFKRNQVDTNRYDAKAVLFKIIPISIKDQQFTFVTKNDKTYMKVIFPKSKSEEYMAVRSTNVPVSDAWKSREGTYKVIGKVYACKDCAFMNFEELKMTLSEEFGMLKMRTEGKSPDTKSNLYLDIVSDTMAVGGGIGRGTGETVKVLDNGNIYYSGFEFTRMK
jgi:CubicO group peptidase (beta-lactamase class C family)